MCGSMVLPQMDYFCNSDSDSCASQNPFQRKLSQFLLLHARLLFYQWSVSAVIGSIPLPDYVSMFPQNILLFHDVMTVFCFLQCCIFLCLEHSKHLIHCTEWIKCSQIRQLVISGDKYFPKCALFWRVES